MHCRRSAFALCIAGIAALASVGAADTEPRLAAAVQERDHTAVKALLQRRVEVNQPQADGTTALHWAVHWNDAQTVDLLVRAGANVNASNRFGATPLWMAFSEGKAPIVMALLKAGANAKSIALGGEPVLMTAARSGSVDTVRALLAHGADVNAKEVRQGQTALMWAVGGPVTYPEIVRVLLESGAEVNVRSNLGLTPLLFAVRQGDLASTQMLIQAGANVDERAMLTDGRTMGLYGDGMWAWPAVDGSTALILAIDNGHFDVAMHLLRSGADPNLAAYAYPYPQRPAIGHYGEALKPGFTALHAIAARRGRRAEPGTFELLKALIAHGADVNARTPSKKAPQPLQLNPQPAITWVQVGDVTPFWVAANALDIEAMEVLVAAGADPTIPSMERTTPLMVAAGLGIKSRGPSGGLGRRSDHDVKALRLLVQWGNDVNAINEYGQTAVHGAAFAAAAPAVQFLVDQGAKPSLEVKDSIGRTPLDVANDNFRVEYRPALQNHKPEDAQATIDLLKKLTSE